MNSIKEIILYGAGKICSDICKILENSHIRITHILDSAPSKWGGMVHGIEISSPDLLLGCDTCVCITMKAYESVEQTRKMLLEKYKYNLDKEISYFKLLLLSYLDKQLLEGFVQNRSYEEGKRHIIFECHMGFGLGGIEDWIKQISMELVSETEWPVYILSDMSKYEVPQVLEGHIDYVAIDYPKRFETATVLNIIECLVSHLPFTIITGKLNEVMLGALIVKEYYPKQVKIISVIHSGYEGNYRGHFEMNEYIDFYVGVSKDIQRVMIHKGIKSERVLHMTCPVECQRQLDRTYTLDSSIPIKIGYAGRLASEKRMDLLLKVVEKLEEAEVNYELRIAGTGSYEDAIVQFIEKRGLESKIKMLGVVDKSEIPAYWSDIDICVNISDMEGRSISILEAMANGAIPVVAETSGVHEDITDGQNGYIIGLRDYNEMALKIQYLAENRALLEELGRNAHKEIYPKSSMNDHLEFWDKLLEKVSSS